MDPSFMCPQTLPENIRRSSGNPGTLLTGSAEPVMSVPL